MYNFPIPRVVDTLELDIGAQFSFYPIFQQSFCSYEHW